MTTAAVLAAVPGMVAALASRKGTPRAAGAASALERPIREPPAVCCVTRGRPRDSPAPRLRCTTGQKHSADLAGLRDGGEVAAVHATVSPWATREHPEAPASKPALGGALAGPVPQVPAGLLVQRRGACPQRADSDCVWRARGRTAGNTGPMPRTVPVRGRQVCAGVRK